jgi:dTDP-4-amino-4,6-dideoxygalactose transaminase
MDKLIRLSKSCLGDLEKAAVAEVLDREYLGMGAQVQEFELALTNFLGQETICVVNGTAALQLALQACEIGNGDEVLVQSLTYLSSFQSISANGAIPVACDINPDTLTLDLVDAEKRLTSKTKAVMPVHYAGEMGNLDEIYAFAKKNDLRVIEDAAHAFGSTYNDKRIGAIGDIVCFSFDGIKNITSGEGGCIVTRDLKVINKVKDARLLGVQRDSDMRFNGQRSWEFNVISQGWRYHMSNIMAAIGVQQLKRFSELSERRRFLASCYDSILAQQNQVKFFKHDYSRIVPHIYVIELPEASNRQIVRKKLLEKGIETGIHYQPNHLLEFYKTSVSLPVTERVFPRLLTLPLHPDLSVEDIDYVCKELIEALD